MPRDAAEKLSTIYREFRNNFAVPGNLQLSSGLSAEKYIIEGVVNLMNDIRKLNPLIHQV